MFSVILKGESLHSLPSENIPPTWTDELLNGRTMRWGQANHERVTA